MERRSPGLGTAAGGRHHAPGTGAAAPGDIVLLHSVGKNTPKATEIIIRTLSGKGFGFVTVSDFV
jgi:hypothetical protein